MKNSGALHNLFINNMSVKDTIVDIQDVANLPIAEMQRRLKEITPLDDLIALVENGPVWDGEVPSKSGRDVLLDAGLAVRVVHNGHDGYTAATYKGRDWYVFLYGSGDFSETLPLVIEARKQSVRQMSNQQG